MVCMPLASSEQCPERPCVTFCTSQLSVYLDKHASATSYRSSAVTSTGYLLSAGCLSFMVATYRLHLMTDFGVTVSLGQN